MPQSLKEKIEEAYKERCEELFEEFFLGNQYSSFIEVRSFLLSSIESVLKECLPKETTTEFDKNAYGVGFNQCRSEFVKKAELLGFNIK